MNRLGVGLPAVLRHLAGILAMTALLGTAGVGRAQDAGEIVRTHLYEAKLAEGQALLAQELARNPGDGNAQFGLGLVRFVRAIEHLGQSLHHYGLRAPNRVGVPILRMPVPENPDPAALSYEDFRAVLRDFVADLASADAALATVGDKPVEISLDLSQVRVDIVGDGGKREDERLWMIFAGVDQALAAARDPRGTYVVALDRGDVAWLRGYSHLLMAFTEAWLAYDFHELFDQTFGLFFPRAGLAETFSHEDDRERTGWTGSDLDIADAISMVHLVRWPVTEPDRLLRAREHLLQMIASSRTSWAAILKRTEDKPRWVPGPGQRGIIQGFDVTPERVESWMYVLDDAEAALEGRKLVPHWRFTKGINLKRVFTEPRTFDLVLWMTGPAARPYLEQGEIISSQSWNQIDRVFGGNFLTYAFWFN